MGLSKNSANDQNISTAGRPITIAPTEVAANRIKTEVITIDDEDDYKTQSPPVDHHSSDQAGASEVTNSTLSFVTTGVKENLAMNSNTTNRQSKTDAGVDDEKKPIEADEQVEMKPKPNYDSDDSGDDFEPSTPPSKSPIPEPEVKPELIVGDDDDFKPDPPASDMGDSQSQQQHVGGCSAEDEMGSPAGVGSSPQEEHSISGRKRSKLKRNVKEKKQVAGRKKTHDGKKKNMKAKSQKAAGYCVACKRQYVDIYKHLGTQLSTPVHKCSKCTYCSNFPNPIRIHIRAEVCGRGGAKAERLRSNVDVAAELRQLKETHLGAAPQDWPYIRIPDWPYRCMECKKEITQVSYHILKHHLKLEPYECPVCGWSSHWEGIQAHMKKRHPSCNTRPIWNVPKFRDQIRVMQKGIIVRNKK